jgi:hypothetical protein
MKNIEMELINEILNVTNISPLPEKIGIYKLNTEGLTGYRCGFKGCFEPPRFVVSYGRSVGAVYACRYHAMEQVNKGGQ